MSDGQHRLEKDSPNTPTQLQREDKTPQQLSQPNDPKDNAFRLIPTEAQTTEAAQLTDDPRDNPSAPLSPAPHQDTSDDTKDNPSATLLQQSPAASSASTPNLEGLRLRSGTVLPREPPQIVSFNKYLENLYETARESDRLAALYSDVLESRNTQEPEQRLAQLEHFREEADKFTAELQKFDRFSRSLILDDKFNKENTIKTFVDTRLSDSQSVSVSAENLNASDTISNYLGNSLQEDSQIDNPQEGSNFSCLRPNKKCVKMVDYTKVVKLTAQMVPLFSGEPNPQLSLELQTFLGCCRQVKQCLSEEEQAAFLQILITRLRGSAYQLLASDIPTTFKEVEDRLNRAYLPRETYQELVNRLITIRQNPLEALSAFTTRLKQLLVLCNEAAESKYGAAAAPAVKAQLVDFAKNALKSGVSNPHLTQYMLTIRDEPIEELIQKALDMERLLQGSLYFQPPTAHNNFTLNPFELMSRITPNYSQEIQRTDLQHTATPSPPNTALQVQSVKNFTGPNQSNHQVTSTPKSAASKVTCSFCNYRGHTYDECLKRKNTPYCLNCKRNGHDIRDCRNNRPNSNTGQPRGPPNRQPQDQNNASNPRVYTVRLKCDFCGRKDHSVQQCKQKLRWEKRSQGNDHQSTQKSPARL